MSSQSKSNSLNKTTIRPKNIVVLISGNGSNLQSIIDSQHLGKINGEIKAVISNKKHAYGLERARQAHISTVCIEHEKFENRTAFEHQLIETLEQYKPDLIVLAGFMRILSSDFVQHYLGKIINIHPSLLPKYKGLHTHRQVIENGDKTHGTSVHFVTAELDGGPIVAQREINVDKKDTEQSLVAKIQQQEHELYPSVIAWFCAEKLNFEIVNQEGRVKLNGKIL